MSWTQLIYMGFSGESQKGLMMHIRIGKYVLPLKDLSFQEIAVVRQDKRIPGVSMAYRDETLDNFWEDVETPEYKSCREFMDAQMDLHTYNMQVIRQSVFDPFQDGIITLFSLFRQLPDHEQMTMQLQSDGRGDIRLYGEIIAYWVSLDEGITRLEAYRKSGTKPPYPLTDEEIALLDELP